MGAPVTTIYWASRHPPLRGQVTALAVIKGGPVRVVQDPRPFDSAQDILARYERTPAPRDIVVVAPLAVLAAMCREGATPLWAEMKTISSIPECAGSAFNPDTDVRLGKKHVRFVRFRRILAVTLTFGEP